MFTGSYDIQIEISFSTDPFEAIPVILKSIILKGQHGCNLKKDNRKVRSNNWS